MSYRRAWLLVSAVNAMFDQPAVTGFAGGSQGGGAELTPFGARLVAAYRSLEAQGSKAADLELAELVPHLTKPDPSG